MNPLWTAGSRRSPAAARNYAAIHGWFAPGRLVRGPTGSEQIDCHPGRLPGH